MEKRNLFAGIPEIVKNEIFETLLGTQDIKVEKIISQGHTSPDIGWYDQKQNEWILLLQGEALLSFEKQPDVQLKKGDFIDIKAHTKHKVAWTSSDPKCIWLAIFY
jgi:cupin 2 domain-containing protein